MYPRISDFINDVLGTDILLPIQSFGFFVAMAFLVGYFLIRHEFIRKEKEGVFKSKKVKVSNGGPIPIHDVLLSFFFFGLVGYKLGLMIVDYTGFSSNPQAALLSTKGSVLWAVIAAALGGGYRLYEHIQRKDSKAVITTEMQSLSDELGVIFTIAFIAGIIGAKIFHNLEYWDQFMKDPMGSLMSFDGLTFYGGLIVGAFSVMYYVNKKGYPILPGWDAAAPTLILGYGIGRLGCMVAGDGDWGIDNLSPKPDWLSWLPDGLWAYRFPHNVLGEGVPIPGCVGEYCNQLANPVFPTPIYETTMAVIIFAILWSLRKKLPYWGQMTGLFFFFNGLERFLIEKIRVNAPIQIGDMVVTQAEIISSILMLLGIVIFVLATTRWKKQDPPKPATSSPNPKPAS